MTPQRLPKGLPDPGLNDPDVDREPKPEGEERKGLNQRDVNTATIPVLQSLGPNITLGDAEGLVSAREEGGFVDYANIFAPLIDPRLVEWISESTSYFQLKAVVQIDTVRVSLFTMLVRNSQTGDVTPILRSLGTI